MSWNADYLAEERLLAAAMAGSAIAVLVFGEIRPGPLLAGLTAADTTFIALSQILGT